MREFLREFLNARGFSVYSPARLQYRADARTICDWLLLVYGKENVCNTSVGSTSKKRFMELQQCSELLNNQVIYSRIEVLYFIGSYKLIILVTRPRDPSADSPIALTHCTLLFVLQRDTLDETKEKSDSRRTDHRCRRQKLVLWLWLLVCNKLYRLLV